MKVNLHGRLMDMTRNEMPNHVVVEDGEKCFNLFSFLEALESRCMTFLDGNDAATGAFSLDAHAVSRYLWCCLALADGDQPAGTTFHELPILD